ncbi:hypothetical protein D1646_08130 [Pseudoflavonifractor sp. 60]|uniref:hypothetical protein n=1 Tax=Pseudoflavonifractor sp. 60 TaxID=2304576 RepID=UPI0013709A1D|nr:hypothetical protein [Pseudoflavonifractor sp. 60]NBI66784.1 hypothetical protein [Pseudoflavonifractor sp. 60]
MASIYEQIRAAIQPDGTLPGEFSIQPPPEEEGGLRFVEGARDGITFYHLGGGGNPELLAQLEEITRLAAGGGDYEAVEPKLAACFGGDDGLLSSVDDLQQWIIDHREELDPSRLFSFANAVLLHSASLGAVKYALAVLELLASAQGTWQETVRTLALAEELTLYCAFVAGHWENRNEELFAIAQKVRGWGRVHAVRMLEPASQEMKDWLLDEGWQNDILPSYTALACAQGGGLRRRLEEETLSRGQLDAADGLIRALLDEGPVRNISLMEDAEDLLLAWLDQLERAEFNEEDQRTLRCLREEFGDQDWPRVQERLGRMEV